MKDQIKKDFIGIDEVLTRTQMKEILGGLVSCTCHDGLSCSLVDSAHPELPPYKGDCEAGFGGGSGGYMDCGCATDYGVYTPSSGISHCCS